MSLFPKKVEYPFKILLFVTLVKSLNNTAPKYLLDLLQPYSMFHPGHLDRLGSCFWFRLKQD